MSFDGNSMAVSVILDRKRRHNGDTTALGEKKYFLFDIDGPLAVDDTLFDVSRELIAFIDEPGG